MQFLYDKMEITKLSSPFKNRKAQIFIQGGCASNTSERSKPVEKNACDLEILILKLEALLKRLNKLMMNLSWDFFAFEKSKTSSAKRR